MRYRGKEPWSGLIKYKDHYEVTSITDAISQLLMLFKDLALPSETFAKTQLKRLVAELDGKLPNEDALKINSEIEKMDFNEWSEEVRTQSKSPAAQQKPQATPMTAAEMVQTSVKANVGSTNKLKA
jgi:hypothetical protein